MRHRQQRARAGTDRRRLGAGHAHGTRRRAGQGGQLRHATARRVRPWRHRHLRRRVRSQPAAWASSEHLPRTSTCRPASDYASAPLRIGNRTVTYRLTERRGESADRSPFRRASCSAASTPSSTLHRQLQGRHQRRCRGGSRRRVQRRLHPAVPVRRVLQSRPRGSSRPRNAAARTRAHQRGSLSERQRRQQSLHRRQSGHGNHHRAGVDRRRYLPRPQERPHLLHRHRDHRHAAGHRRAVRQPRSARDALQSAARAWSSQAEIAQWKGSIISGIQSIPFRSPTSSSAAAGEYWEKADLRIVLNTTITEAFNGGTPMYPIEVQTLAGARDVAKTNALQAVHARRRLQQPVDSSRMDGTRPIFYTDVPAQSAAATAAGVACTCQARPGQLQQQQIVAATHPPTSPTTAASTPAISYSTESHQR